MSDNTNADRNEAIQAVVDRVSSYQDGAPEGTVETELTAGLGEVGIQLDPADVRTLAEAIETEHGGVSVADVLG